jgi:hypothetical protein
MKPGVKEARKRWPKAIWIIGRGEYASVSHCHPGATVMLFETRMEAEIAKTTIDDTSCGGSCRRNHEIVYLGPHGRGDPAILRSEVIGEVQRRTAEREQLARGKQGYR